MTRRTIALAILLAWFGALGWLLARRLTQPPGTALLLAASRLSPGASYYAFELAGRPVGSGGLTIDTLSTGFTVLQLVGLDGLSSEDGEVRLALRTEARLGRTFRLLTARSNLTEGAALSTREVVTDADGLATIRAGSPEIRARQVTAVEAGGATLPAMFGFKLSAAGSLKPGTLFDAPTLDPVVGVPIIMRARVIGDSTWILTDSATVDTVSGAWTAVPTDTVQAWRLEVLTPVPATLWVTSEGWPIRWEYPFGATLQRQAFEMVELDYRRQRRAGLLGPLDSVAGLRSVIELNVVPPTRPADRTLVLSTRHGAPPPGAMAHFAGGRQRVEGDTVVIGWTTRQTGPPPPLHYRNTEGFSAREEEDLAAGLALAVERYGNEADTVAALVRWLAQDVRLEGGVSAAVSPAVVARLGSGSDEGKVELFVALARRAGYAARAVTGILVEHPLRPRHVWAEVWRDGWQAVDPVFGHVPASASLLRVLEGAAKGVSLVTVAGDVNVTLIPASGERRQRRH